MITTTTTTTTPSPGGCLNGGTWDGNKCICPDEYYGPLCEFPMCQNGGTWNNGICQCPPNFHGVECQLVTDTIEVADVEVNATVDMKVKVDNRNFTDDLNNSSSQAFKDFEMEFKQQMAELYRNVKGYQGVVIHSLSNGSIIVNYTVLLKVPATATANSTVQSISAELVAAVNSYTNCCQSNASCGFCFNSSFTNITSYRADEVDANLCVNQVPEEFKNYYSPIVTKLGVFCVTRCDKRVANPYTCTYGTCVVERTGPRCECSDQAAFWYLDSVCASRVSKVGVAVGVPVAVLAIVATVFTVFLLRTRRENLEYREKLSSRSELYDDEDENWSSPQGFASSNEAANWEGSETPNVYISLENVDTSQKIHIQKPSSILP